MASNLTPAALSAQNMRGSEFELDLSGAIIPLPHISYDNGFEVSRGYDGFTVCESGFYIVRYKVSADSAGNLSAALRKNGAAIPVLTDETSGEKTHSGEAVVFLNVGDLLQLAVSGRGKIQLTAHTGAALNIIKIA